MVIVNGITRIQAFRHQPIKKIRLTKEEIIFFILCVFIPFLTTKYLLNNSSLNDDKH